MSPLDSLGYGLTDLWVGSWETRHSLFAHFALFGAFATALVMAAAPLRAGLRAWWVVVLSVAGLAFLGSADAAAIALGYAVTHYLAVEYLPAALSRVIAWLWIGAMLIYPALIPADLLAGNPSHMREFWAFATNVWLLRCIAYQVDRHYRGAPHRGLREYLEATLFLPTFVNGPVETPEQLAERRTDGPSVPTWEAFADYRTEALRQIGRFAWGIAKVLVATFYLGQDNETIFATAGTAVSHPRLWLWAIELYFQFYIVFSGWTDVAVSMGKLMGYGVQENFDRPWVSRSVAEFWRRWHASFGAWLRNYIYFPLGGSRRRRFWNVLAVFLVSGLWHVWGALKVLGPQAYPPSAWTGFIVWGLMNGLAVAAHPWWEQPLFAPVREPLERSVPAGLRKLAAQGIAFGFVAVAWIPFFLPPWVDASLVWHIFLRIVYIE